MWWPRVGKASASATASLAGSVERPSLSGGDIVDHAIATSTSTVTVTTSNVTVTATASSRRLAVVLAVRWLRLRIHRRGSSWGRAHRRSLAHPALDTAERGHRAEQQHVLLLERRLGRRLQLRLAQLLRHRLRARRRLCQGVGGGGWQCVGVSVRVVEGAVLCALAAHRFLRRDSLRLLRQALQLHESPAALTTSSCGRGRRRGQ